MKDQATRSCKVLVVEDEGLIALDIAGRLEALGHEVVATVGTAREAVEQAAGADLVLMDIHLDGTVDGIDAASLIRERYRLPVIFLTAHADRATLDRAKLAGPFGYIVKPLTAASLNASLEVALYKHRMERMIEEREALLRTTLSSVADAVVVTGVDGRVLMLNRAAEALTGWMEPEAEGQPVSKVVRLIDGQSGEDSGDDPVPLALLRDAPVPLERGTQVSGRSGRQLTVEGAVAPVKGSGAALGAVVTFRDVTARRWEERQLRQSQKMEAVGRLAAAVSSDYSNLLASIRNRASQLMLQFGEYSPARQAIEEIHQSASAAEQITRRLANLGARQVNQPEVVSLNGMLRRMAKLIESVAGPGIQLVIRPDPGASRIKADATHIEQAIMNLVLHACAQMGAGGQLLIETGTAEAPAAGGMSSYVLLAITHSGSEPNLDTLFEPVSTRDDGLSLSMVHGIVTEHGGYVSAQATSSGACRFDLLLPQWSQPDLPPRPETAEKAPCVLLVDYRDRVRLQLHNFFETNGYDLLEAADAGEALALAEVHEGALDVLVADDAEAGAIAADLRRTHPELEVLRIVGRPESSANEIQRPFTQAALLDRIGALLAARPKLESASAG
jgi:two-component system cell cycle sensor histidine kinase/response regulator CckA